MLRRGSRQRTESPSARIIQQKAESTICLWRSRINTTAPEGCPHKVDWFAMQNASAAHLSNIAWCILNNCWAGSAATDRWLRRQRDKVRTENVLQRAAPSVFVIQRSWLLGWLRSASQTTGIVYSFGLLNCAYPNERELSSDNLNNWSAGKGFIWVLIY